jgi:HK97 family phage major capsid protein
MEQKTVEELLERRTQISSEIYTEGADLDALETECRAINEELERRKAVEAQKKELREAVAEGEGEKIKEFTEERDKQMTIEEIRSSKEYLDAWAEGIKTGRYDECRKMLTSNAENPGLNDGVVPVPTFVEGRIQGMFERNEILSRVRRAFFRGNLKVGFEISSTGAVVHNEGTAAIDDEELIIGTVEIIAAMLKKTILISDELLDMHGEEFLDYIFDEFENKIETVLAGSIVDAIVDAPAASTSSAVGVPAVTADTIALDIVAQALANITEGSNYCIVMNRGTYAAFRAAQLAAGYAVDPFEGLPIVYTSALPSIGDAAATETWLIVGDLSAITVNFPAGDQVKFIYDPYTNAQSDLVRVTGRLYAGVGITAPGKLAKVAKDE